ncbi:hypothetical protein BDW66DRAFT_155739 [Aspergillus desertorum]
MHQSDPDADSADVEKGQASAAPAVTFGPDERDGHSSSRLRLGRQPSRGETISISRTRSLSRSGNVPIEFRRISFQITESEAKREAFGDNAARLKSATKGGNLHDADYFESINFHSVDPAILLRNLETADCGLAQRDAAARLLRDGKNTFPHRKPSYFKKIIQYIFGGFCSVLWVGVIVFFICWRPLGDPNPAAYNLGLAILILIVIFLQASFSAFQDWSTARTMSSILDLIPADAVVVRDGQAVQLPSTDLVRGDIVKISAGNKVPADLRLLSASGDLRFDRSLLTGEAEEVAGTTDLTDTNFLETRNIALMGTLVTNGNATGVVVLTGRHSVMGHIAVASNSGNDQPTLIQREITRFVMIIVVLTVCLACLLLFTWVGWLRVNHKGYMNVIAMLNNIMGCVVAFIPEGMPVAVALTLMVIAKRMKKHNVLPKGLSTVETLGCVNVICSDKTGTLTENRMTAVTVAFVDHSMSVEEAVESGADANQALRALHRAAALCNDATFELTTLNAPVLQRTVLGNATDAAVLKFVETLQSDSVRQFADRHPRVFDIPFSSKNKWMLTLHQTDREQTEKPTFLLLAKGASDILLPYCTSYWSNTSNAIQPLNSSAREQLAAVQEEMSRKAQRVILLCQRYVTPVHAPGTNDFADEVQRLLYENLTIIGLIGIVDPPRKEASSTVAQCRRAGARFFMVTGDLGLTGAAIARDIGIFTGSGEPDTIDTIKQQRHGQANKSPDSPTSLLLEGPSISQLTDSDWDAVCAYQEIVFGRTMPDQKLRIVNELKARHNIVAVTGDGVNDAPAMRAADVGIAVITGSDVALEAADLVLMDKFDSIVEAIRLGRLVFQNLQKVISYLLPAGSWSEIWPVLLNVFFGVPLPLSTFLMIIICVFTDLFCALSLILEQQEFDLLDLPPRNPAKDHLITLKVYAQSYFFIGVMETVAAHAMFFLYYWRHTRIPARDLFFAFESYTEGFHGYSQSQLTQFNTTGQSVYFITLLILQWGNILSVRNKRLSILQADPIRKERRNPWLIASCIVSLSIAVFVTEEPGIQMIFGTAPAPLEFWFIPIPLALGILCMDEIRKVGVRVWPGGLLARIAW